MESEAGTLYPRICQVKYEDDKIINEYECSLCMIQKNVSKKCTNENCCYYSELQAGTEWAPGHNSIEDFYAAYQYTDFTQLTWRYPARRENNANNKIILSNNSQQVKNSLNKLNELQQIQLQQQLQKNNREQYLPLLKNNELNNLDGPSERFKLHKSKTVANIHSKSYDSSLNRPNKELEELAKNFPKQQQKSLQRQKTDLTGLKESSAEINNKISDSLCMEYINLLGKSNMAPKYFSETLKLKALEKKQCSRLFKTFKDLWEKNEETLMKKVKTSLAGSKRDSILEPLNPNRNQWSSVNVNNGGGGGGGGGGGLGASSSSSNHDQTHSELTRLNKLQNTHKNLSRLFDANNSTGPLDFSDKDYFDNLNVFDTSISSDSYLDKENKLKTKLLDRVHQKRGIPDIQNNQSSDNNSPNNYESSNKKISITVRINSQVEIRDYDVESNLNSSSININKEDEFRNDEENEVLNNLNDAKEGFIDDDDFKIDKNLKNFTWAKQRSNLGGVNGGDEKFFQKFNEPKLVSLNRALKQTLGNDEKNKEESESANLNNLNNKDEKFEDVARCVEENEDEFNVNNNENEDQLSSLDFNENNKNNNNNNNKRKNQFFPRPLKIDKLKEIKEKRNLTLPNRVNKMRIVKETVEEEEEENYVSGLGDDWLIKWSILGENNKTNKYSNLFKKYDLHNRGHLRGDALISAIQSVCKLNNLKLSYLFSVLNLCDVDAIKHGADLNLFKIIVALGNKINYLDDDWFKNNLPQFDMSSIENKMFKVKNLWNCLVNPFKKTFLIRDLMIEFKAGGVSEEHIEFAREKFANKKSFDLIDYLTYIPLFVYMHDQIVKNPLRELNNLI